MWRVRKARSLFSCNKRYLSDVTKEYAYNYIQAVVNGSKGLPRASIYEDLVCKRCVKSILLTSCGGFFEKIDDDVSLGAKSGLDILVASTASDESMTLLGHCSEKRFFDQWKCCIHKMKDFTWKIDRIKSSKLDYYWGIFGAQRGDQLIGKDDFHILGQQFIFSNDFLEIFRGWTIEERELHLSRLLFSHGVILRARAVVTVDQSLYIPKVSDVNTTENNMIEQEENSGLNRCAAEKTLIEQKDVEHMLTFEMSLTPKITRSTLMTADLATLVEKSGGGGELLTNDWSLVDINFSINDNYPLYN